MQMLTVLVFIFFQIFVRNEAKSSEKKYKKKTLSKLCSVSTNGFKRKIIFSFATKKNSF